MPRLRFIFDDDATVQIYRYALPSGRTETARHPIEGRQRGEYVELFLDDGDTGDTIDYGLHGAVIYGIRDDVDVEP